MKKFLIRALCSVLTVVGISYLASCGSGRSYLVIPYSASSASAVTVDNLNLSKGDYQILNTITESASIICEYKGKQIIIYDTDNTFAYVFDRDKIGNWTLKGFAGASQLGFFTSDLNNQSYRGGLPDAEEFARRSAMARIIKAAKDYQADGIVEPIIVSSANNIGKNKIEYTSTVSAKLISINPINNH